jgi:hypothetical protein
MKNKVIVLTAAFVGFSASVSAHQLPKPVGHTGNWNWNQPTHTHAEPAYTPVVAKPMPAKKISGIQSLDGIAKAGECYVPAYVEASCKNEMKRVLVKESYDDIEVIPAVTRTAERKVMIEPAKTITEYVPALYENVSKRVMVEEAHTEWKRGNFTGTTKSVNGETYCLVSVPERFETRIEKVLRIPASTKNRQVPAVYKTYTETVVVTPATTRVVKTHPALYNTVKECVEKTAGRYEWRSVLCEQNATSSVLKAFESALSKSGHLSSSQVDGVIDNKTEYAIKSYQKSKGLAVDGLVNINTVKSLGVKY